MADFMVSFRIAQIGDPNRRRSDLEAAVLHQSQRHWKDTTSFLIIRTERDINSLIISARDVINETYDLVLIRELGHLDARVVGSVDDPDLFVLMPYCKKA